MKNILFRIVFLSSGLITSACASIEVDVAGPLMSPPEIAGQAGSIQVSLGSEQSTRYTFTGDASARPPNLTTSSSRTGGYIHGNLGYAVSDWFQISVGLIPGSIGTPISVGSMLTGHLQVIGQGNAPGPKIAVYGGVITNSASAKGDQNGTFGPGGFNWKANAWSQTLTASTSVGYRFADVGLLVYASGGYADQMVSGGIEHSLSSDGSSPAVNYALPTLKGRTTSAGLGILFGTSTQMGLAARQFFRSWPGDSASGGGESTDNLYSFQLRFSY